MARRVQQEVEPRGAGASVPSRLVELRGDSLRELVDFAETNRPSIVAAQRAVDVARIALLQVRADAPLLSGSVWGASTLSAGIDHSAASQGHRSRLKSTGNGSASGALSLDVLVWDAGRNAAATRSAAENVIAAECACLNEGYAVFESVAKGYFGLLEADAMLDVAFTNEYECAVHLRQAEERLEAGEAQRLDVTRARYDLAVAREKTVAASNAVATCGAELMRALGIDAGSGTCADVLPRRGRPDGAAARAFPVTAFAADEAFSFARTNAPSVAVARARLRAASASVDAAVADLLPSVSVSASLNWTDPLWMWRWGVSLVQPLFTGCSKTLAVRRAVEELKSAASSVDEAEQALSLEISLAVAERDSSAEAYAAAQTSVRTAEDNLAVVKERYLAGEASGVDFTDALAARARSRVEAISAFYRGQLAEARLFAVLGTPPLFEEGQTEGKIG